VEKGWTIQNWSLNKEKNLATLTKLTNTIQVYQERRNMALPDYDKRRSMASRLTGSKCQTTLKK
jgi:hypothetical protein